MSTKGRKLTLVALVVMLFVSLFMLAACSSSSSSSSYGYSYGTRESYDAKYGAGSYDADKALLDSMRDSYNSAIGR